MFAIQLSLLLRPDSSRLNRDSHSGTQTVRSLSPPPPPPPSECTPQALHPPSEEHKDRSDYAHNLSNNSSNLSKMDLMLRQRDTDKVKRSENKVRQRHSRLNHDVPPSYFPLLPLSCPLFRALYSRFSPRFSTVSSDVRPSSMVSFAKVVSPRVQRRKSDVHALPTRSTRWTKRCKARSLSQTTLAPSETTLRGPSLRPSNVVQPARRQGRHPPLPSLPINSFLSSLPTPTRQPPTLPLTPATS